MKLLRTAMLLVAFGALACRDNPGSTPAAPVAAPPPKNVPTVPAAAPAAPVVSPGDSKPAKDENPDLAALNAAYKKFWQETQSPPANLEILVKRGYLKSMPVAPRGKRFVLSWEKMEVTLAPE